MAVLRGDAARRWEVVLSAIVFAMAVSAAADEVQLRGGGRLTGVIVQKTDTAVAIQTAPGLVTIPMSRVQKVVEGRSALDSWLERSAALAPGDAAGWAALARWAETQDLSTQAQAAWQRVLDLQPQNAEANTALGRVQSNGSWMSREEAYRAQGLVPFEGRWVSPAEHESLIRERAAENEAERAEREARTRDAEARAREAEARASEAEATAGQSSADGIPLWGVYGGVYFPFVPGRGYSREGYGANRRPDRDPGDASTGQLLPRTPAVTPRPSSLGPSAATAPAGKPVDIDSKRPDFSGSSLKN